MRTASAVRSEIVPSAAKTGTIAARLLIEFGLDPQGAIQSIRKARPGAIENSVQERYVRGRTVGR